MFLKLPIMVLTWPIFSSISSSRASFVILCIERKLCYAKWVPNSPPITPDSPANVPRLWTDSVSIVHDALRLIIYYFAVVVSLPGPVVFLEGGTPAKDKHHVSLVGPTRLSN